MAHLDESQRAEALFGEPSAEAQRHLDGCAECRAELSTLRDTLGELDQLPPTLTAARREELRTRVIERLAPAPDWTTGAVTAVVALVAFVGLSDSPDLVRWALAISAALGASALVTRAPATVGQAWARVGLALGASLALGAFDLLAHGLGRGPALGEHFQCEYIVSFVAAAPMVSAAFFARRGTDPTWRALHGATGAAAGALAGQAALLTTCSSPEGFLHVAVFHVCAVLGATLVGALVGRALPAHA